MEKRRPFSLKTLKICHFTGVLKRIEENRLVCPNTTNNYHVIDMSRDVAEGTQRPLVYAKQAEVADRAMSIILRDNSSKIDGCRAFEWYILMPYYKALSDQMISRSDLER